MRVAAEREGSRAHRNAVEASPGRRADRPDVVRAEARARLVWVQVCGGRKVDLRAPCRRINTGCRALKPDGSGGPGEVPPEVRIQIGHGRRRRRSRNRPDRQNQATQQAQSRCSAEPHPVEVDASPPRLLSCTRGTTYLRQESCAVVFRSKAIYLSVSNGGSSAVIPSDLLGRCYAQREKGEGLEETRSHDRALLGGLGGLRLSRLEHKRQLHEPGCKLADERRRLPGSAGLAGSRSGDL